MEVHVDPDDAYTMWVVSEHRCHPQGYNLEVVEHCEADWFCTGSKTHLSTVLLLWELAPAGAAILESSCRWLRDLRLAERQP
ncbi:hypothetical protein DXX98_13070 [Janibacter melonis]|nr:hypothetical protein [Janibacter melonis]